MHYEIEASAWLNTDRPLSLRALRGRVVVVTVFQMLCPGCAQTSLPQAARLHALFPREDLAVIGLHSVFEHHAAMTPEALRAFAHEYRLRFPIAIDAARARSPVPITMENWALQGTPSLMVFDRSGALALQQFGHLEDLRLGAVLGELVAQRAAEPATSETRPTQYRDTPETSVEAPCHENCRI
ncbi:redoxin domain-containing protein [Paraburkholderia acidisoli]|uniref:Redoxin domain-containing protein n=1 Tax=Paraburkholderia acidisoli TaxID=2571748 RepID=A0A7Z2GKA3_9BURK|nr:redoxin domain-containing protein [Paraburkholderia acidisoli]QGZ63362.1 redoxin domain-containing protein [Paraburkholderia acidisoli]